MTKLSNQWITDGLLDFEYKKYVLLAYLQYVKKEFDNRALYPHLDQIEEHYQNTLALKNSRDSIRKQFPRQLTEIDLVRMKLRYEELYEENPHMHEVNEILEFAIPRLSETVVEGHSRREEVASRITITPIGIVPLRNEEGYLFVHQSTSRETSILRYQLTLFNSRKERMIQTYPIGVVRKSVSTTFENLKIELTRRYTQLPNPATYMIESTHSYPLNETLLPLAKELVVQYITAG